MEDPTIIENPQELTEVTEESTKSSRPDFILVTECSSGWHWEVLYTNLHDELLDVEADFICDDGEVIHVTCTLTNFPVFHLNPKTAGLMSINFDASVGDYVSEEFEYNNGN